MIIFWFTIYDLYFSKYRSKRTKFSIYICSDIYSLISALQILYCLDSFASIKKIDYSIGEIDRILIDWCGYIRLFSEKSMNFLICLT